MPKLKTNRGAASVLGALPKAISMANPLNDIF